MASLKFDFEWCTSQGQATRSFIWSVCFRSDWNETWCDASHFLAVWSRS